MILEARADLAPERRERMRTLIRKVGVARVEDLKLEIEIHLEELGKQIKSMDELQSLIDGELETPMKTLRELFSKEADRNFTFSFNKFSDDELMTLIHYRKSNFPSRLSAYEDYWAQTLKSEVAQQVGNLQLQNDKVSEGDFDLDAPLKVETGKPLTSNCYLDSDEESGEEELQISKGSEEDPTFDHGVKNLSDFERRNHIPVLTDEETSRILADTENEEVEVEFATSDTSNQLEVSADVITEQDESAITVEEVHQYEAEIKDLTEDNDSKEPTAEEDLAISVEDIEQDLIVESMEKVDEIAQISSDEDFSVSVEELENEFVANASDTVDDADIDSAATDDLEHFVDELDDNVELQPEENGLEVEYADEEYSEAEYTEGEYSEEEYAEAEYAEDGYAETEYAEGEYTETEYTEGEYSEDEYSETVYTEEDYTEDEYAEGQYEDSTYSEGEYPEEEYTTADYGEEEHVEEVFVHEDVENIDNDEGDLALEGLSIEKP